MKKAIIYILIGTGVMNSCTKNFEELNENKKAPTEVPAEPLFSFAQKTLVDQISSTNVNRNVWKLYSQYWTETTYTDETNYNIVSRNIPEYKFRVYYREILNDLNDAKSLLEEEGETGNKIHMIEIMNVFAYQRLVDMFGNIPFSEALDIENISPKYDDAETIYNEILARLDAAIENLDPNGNSFGSADIYYNGDIAAWKKFANSLKLKIGINLYDHNASKARQIIESAVQSGVFESAADNAVMSYEGAQPNTNPLHEDLVLSGRRDFIPTNTIIDIMNSLQDPRRDEYFEVNGTEYRGGKYGYLNTYSEFSHIGEQIKTAEFSGILLTYSEVMFYLAEAAERGFNVGGTAKEFYDSGIRASILYWGGTDAEADTYLANPDVAYTTAPGDWKEKIGTQSWLASYTRGLIGYTTWRRLDHPTFNLAETITSMDQIPTRFTYPVNEQTLNSESYSEAAAAIGGDMPNTKIFWDR